MRTGNIIVLLSATVMLAGCDFTPTQPGVQAGILAAPDSAERLLAMGASWGVVSLSFAPAAINDAGVVVGSSNGNAVRWENGTLIILPHSGALPGPYEAVDITSKGLILGTANGHVLLWKTPTSAPLDLAYPPYALTPTAVNDNSTIVGMRCNWTCNAFRWTPFSGFTSVMDDSISSYVTGVNASGEMSGYYAGVGSDIGVRWSATGVATKFGDGQPCLPGSWVCYTQSVFGLAINDRGDLLLGVSVSRGVFYNRVEMYVVPENGTSTSIPVTTGAVALSNAGRVIGETPWTFYNGVVTNLPYSDVDPPSLRDVNTCGWIVGVRNTVPATGYLWRRGGGITATCDASPTIGVL